MLGAGLLGTAVELGGVWAPGVEQEDFVRVLAVLISELALRLTEGERVGLRHARLVGPLVGVRVAHLALAGLFVFVVFRAEQQVLLGAVLEVFAGVRLVVRRVEFHFVVIVRVDAPERVRAFELLAELMLVCYLPRGGVDGRAALFLRRMRVEAGAAVVGLVTGALASGGLIVENDVNDFRRVVGRIVEALHEAVRSFLLRSSTREYAIYPPTMVLLKRQALSDSSSL